LKHGFDLSLVIFRKFACPGPKRTPPTDKRPIIIEGQSKPSIITLHIEEEIVPTKSIALYPTLAKSSGGVDLELVDEVH
jgi:hypothetical protein